MKFTRNFDSSVVEFYPHILFPKEITLEYSWASLVKNIYAENPYVEWPLDSRKVSINFDLSFRGTVTQKTDFINLIDGLASTGDKTITIEGDNIICGNSKTVTIYVSEFGRTSDKSFSLTGYLE